MISNQSERIISHDGRTSVRIPCGRCGGTGHYSYNPIDGTVCFDCRGRKWAGSHTAESFVQYRAAEIAAELCRERTVARKEARMLAAVQARQADPDPRIAALATAYGLKLETVQPEEVKRHARFAADLIAQYLRGAKPLSESQWEWVAKLTADAAERIAQVHAETEARQRFLGTVGESLTVECEVFMAERIPGMYYNSPPRLKLGLRAGSGETLYWTTGMADVWSVHPGDRITVTAPVKDHYTSKAGTCSTILGGRGKASITKEGE